MTKLWGVPQAEIREAWPMVEYILAKGLEVTTRMTLESVEKALRDGDQQLWVAWDQMSIYAVGITEVYQTPHSKICCIVFATGEIDALIEHIETIEAWAKDLDCTGIEILGRRGWARKLDGYDATLTLLEKAI